MTSQIVVYVSTLVRDSLLSSLPPYTYTHIGFRKAHNHSHCCCPYLARHHVCLAHQAQQISPHEYSPNCNTPVLRPCHLYPPHTAVLPSPSPSLHPTPLPHSLSHTRTHRYVHVRRTILVRLVDAVRGVRRLVEEAVAAFLDKWQKYEWSKFVRDRPNFVVTMESTQVAGNHTCTSNSFLRETRVL